MTGHGSGQNDHEGLSASVDIRTINSRYFKLNIRGFDTAGALDSRIESLVRKRVNRGTVNVQVRLSSQNTGDDYKINCEVLLSYAKQIRSLSSEDITMASSDALLALPGVISEPGADDRSPEEIWKAIEPAIVQALDDLQKMRAREGEAMTADLNENLGIIAEQLSQIEQRSPEVVTAYQTRLHDKIQKSLEELDVKISKSDLIREVGLFSERCDISEETVRLRSHLDQFKTISQARDASGRKLDFLVQEMFRETNTIGSKANDAIIAQHVIEIKTRIERMREQIQNIE